MNDEELGDAWTTLEPTVRQRRRIDARVFAWLEARDTPLAAEWLAPEPRRSRTPSDAARSSPIARQAADVVAARDVGAGDFECMLHLVGEQCGQVVRMCAGREGDADEPRIVESSRPIESRRDRAASMP